MAYIRQFGAALIDYRGLVTTIRNIADTKDFSLLHFIDYCALAEGMILYDSLIMVGIDKEDPYSFPPYDGILTPFIKLNILVPEPIKTKPMYLGNPPKIGKDLRRDNILRDSWYETRRLLGAEKEYHIPSLALLRQKAYYEKSAYVIEDHSVCNLFGQYKKMSEALLTLRQQSVLPIKQYIIIPIPPIPYLLLKMSSYPEDLLKNIIAIREDYARLRLELRKLREDLADPTQAPINKLRAIASWNKSWLTLDKYTEASSISEMALATNNLIDVAETIGGIGINSIQWSTLIEKLINEFANAFYSWRVRLLHKAANIYLSTSDDDIRRQLFRVYKREFTKVDVDRLKARGIPI